MIGRMSSLIAAGAVAASCSCPDRPPAQAMAIPCTSKDQNTTVLSGDRTNQIDVKLCGWRTVDEDTVQGFAEIDWLIQDRDINFSKFEIQTRIEKRAAVDASDAMVDSAICDLTKIINSSASPSYPEQCYPSDAVWYNANY